ncbi:MAG: 8-oxo-dGTP diphosphatase [Candidatus Shapirobacteria bacterium]|nr:8-oxo-dGTP diphosphatase [Candidatus Shapirobacteria bacterium]
MTQEATVVYLVKDNKVCMGMKKRGFGIGRWNGFGGKPKDKEMIEETAVRELLEESGVKADKENLIKRGKFYYYQPNGDWQINVFILNIWEGEPAETEEMKPEWFEIEKLPLEQMWENDALWIGRVLKGERLTGTVWHDENDKVVKYELKEVV